MKLWWCMECQTEVELNKHGRCGVCNSESVDLVFTENELKYSVSIASKDSDTASLCA